MDARMLARLEHQNLVDTLAMLAAQVPRALVTRGGGVTLIATGLPIRLLNQVLIESDAVAPEAIRAAVSATRARGDRFVVNLRAGADDRHLPLIADLGLVPMSADPWMPGMAFHPLPGRGTVPLAPDHQIRRVTDVSGLRDHIVTAAAGFGLPAEWIEPVMTEALVDRPEASVYVGYTDGEPVSTGMGVRIGRTIGIYNISTRGAARRRGYGAAMTMRIVDDGAADGCDVAILQATEMGRPVYERLGFRTVVEHMGYVDPASLEPEVDPHRTA